MQKTRNKIPTTEEFLNYIPKKRDFEWYTEEDKLVRIVVPKFKSNIGKAFCKVIRKDKTFIANLDKLGSLVWLNCDGKKTVKQILEIIKKEFPTEKNIDQRLFLFLQQMNGLNYIDFFYLR